MNTAVSVPMDFIKSGVAEVSVLFTLSVSAINPLPNEPVVVAEPEIVPELEICNIEASNQQGLDWHLNSKKHQDQENL